MLLWKSEHFTSNFAHQLGQQQQQQISREMKRVMVIFCQNICYYGNVHNL